jgi:cysteine desulfurase/selenocysteine lyase
MDSQETIYLNHAGTSWPKPHSVLTAAASVLQSDPTSWPDLFQSAHHTVAEFFHVDPKRLLLTPSCTAALNLAITDHVWNTGDRVVTSNFEHHALYRALVKLNEHGVDVTTLPQGKNDLIQLDALETELKSGGVRLVALTAACNVTGHLLPISDAIVLAHAFDATVLVDGAQIAGWWDLAVPELGADLFTFAGHKGPQAPWGIGGLFVSPNVSMNCPEATCERPEPQAASPCSVMPGYCDAGSINLAALAGLAAGCRWLNEPQQIGRLQHARNLAEEFTGAVRNIPGVVVHHDVSVEKKVPTVAITVEHASCTETAARLRARGLITSGGFQCAPQAHRALGTDRTGVIRFSFGPTNDVSDVARAAEGLRLACKT